MNNILKNMVKIAKLPEHETIILTTTSVRKHLSKNSWIKMCLLNMQYVSKDKQILVPFTNT
jgi:hypothetical protein